MYLWDEMTWDEFQAMVCEKKVDTALIPCGSMEEHGRHMPIGSDAFIAHRLCMEIAKDIAALVVPPVYWGVCTHPYDITSFPGVYTIDDEVLIALYVSIAKSLSKHGIKKFLLINGHAGNAAACEIAVRRIREQTDGVAGTFSWRSASGHIIRNLRQQGKHMGIHACEIETSVALALIKEKVNMDKAVKNPKITYPDTCLSWDIDPGPRAWYNWDFDVSSTEPGNMGDPSLASEEKGRMIIKAVMEQADKLLCLLDSQLKKVK